MNDLQLLLNWIDAKIKCVQDFKNSAFSIGDEDTRIRTYEEIRNLVIMIKELEEE